MYLISLYFDADAESKLQSYMREIASSTANEAMTEGKIPPHITVAAFHSYKEETALEIFRNITKKISPGKVLLPSIGCFFPRVMYAAPVLNEYLGNIMSTIYKEVTEWDGVVPDERYRPYRWMPHITIGKNLTKEQMQKAFCTMQNQFAPFEGAVVRIGLAKTNPYTDLENYVLK